MGQHPCFAEYIKHQIYVNIFVFFFFFPPFFYLYFPVCVSDRGSHINSRLFFSPSIPPSPHCSCCLGRRFYKRQDSRPFFSRPLAWTLNSPFRTAVPFRGQTSQVVCPKNGTAVLNGLEGFYWRRLYGNTVKIVGGSRARRARQSPPYYRKFLGIVANSAPV